MRVTRSPLLVGLLLVASAVWAQTGPVVVESGGIKLSVALGADKAEVTVTAPGTGWVAVGFDPSTRMKDANFLIGYVKDGVAYARDDFGVGSTSHQRDQEIGGKNDLLSFSGSETGGTTTLTFVIPRNSGDPKDTVLSSGKHTVILGYSNADNFTAMHRKVIKTTITLP